MIGDRLMDAALARGDGRTGGVLVLPVPEISVFREVARRVVLALLIIAAVTALVYVQREGYRDVDDDVSLLDSLYYATVGVSTTGYGDITAVTESARLVNTLLVTPLRILFLLVLVGTTLEVLTTRTRGQLRLERWRRSLGGHTVVIGYGTKGAAAVDAVEREVVGGPGVVVVDVHAERIASASDAGLVAVTGDGMREDVQRAAGVDIADRVIIALGADDAAILAALTARRLNPTARIVAAARLNANAQLLRDSGADTVIVSSEAAGRLLGVSVAHPGTGEVANAFLGPDRRLALRERAVRAEEVGQRPEDLPDRAVAILRGGRSIAVVGGAGGHLQDGDRLVVLAAQRT